MLKLVCSLGAGVDHILSDPNLPNVRICRIVDHQLTSAMRNYIIMGVLNFQRRMQLIWQNQQMRRWEKVLPIKKTIKVGILGLGVLGSDVGKKLALLGFEVYGYAQSPKQIEGIHSFCGEEELKEMLKKVNVIVCLLPLTSKTKNFMDHYFFARLQKGSYLIHVARGEHLVDEDLLDALASKTLEGALLDLFREEPLPQNHPFWHHPNITITPHIASITDPASAARQMVENHQRMLKGEPPLNEVDLYKEY